MAAQPSRWAAVGVPRDSVNHFWMTGWEDSRDIGFASLARIVPRNNHMNRPEIQHRLEAIVNSTGGREYTVTVRGHERKDGRWEGMLEFAPVGPGGRTVITPVQTT